ncbi:54S ribosomal protein c83.06c, mitochondrial [Habropoda laboriosa]|uniref:Large ribosomal subunit protein bL36m n=1 Tax=Habropoda laboriosa TaxID=597456 RepID=A0A0L7QP44_9HYME|nr:54S ribosomal protein c83.06c, mitochondrial [Habropoda laboriosa]
MNISSLFRIACHTVGSIAPKVPPVESLTRIINRNMHYICNKQNSYSLPNMCTNQISSVLLQPSLPTYNLTSGFKMKTILHRRCHKCLRMWKNDRQYIICKEHPRHNQVQRKKHDYKTWILTFASQSKVREW